MRFALGAVAGAVALPALAACGTTKTAANSSAAGGSSSAAAPVKLLPATGTPSWPIDVARAQPTAPWSMYATSGSGDSMLPEMVSYGRDIWNKHDDFSLFAEQASGAGTWSVQVGYMSPTNAAAKAGIMIRQTLDPGSPNYAFVTTVSQGAKLQYRPVANNASSGHATADALASTPIFLKMVYQPGKQIVLSDSSDGKTWGNTQTIPLGAGSVDSAKNTWVMAKNAPKGAIPDMITGTYYVGLCACSHAATLQGYAGFTDFTGFHTTKLSYHAINQGSSAKANW